MWALLLAIVVVGIALAAVSAARRDLWSKRESAAPQRHCCTPCCHSCQRDRP